MRAAALLAGSAGEVADLLELWEGEEEEWTNGVVVELGKRFWCPEVVTAAIRLVARLLGIHLQRLTREVRDRVRHCLARTESMMKSAGAAAEEAWLYLVVLKPGGRLALAHQHLFSPPTTYEALVGRLAAQVTGEEAACGHCREWGDYRVCRGCLSTPYCSRLCQRKAWVAGHQDQCSTLALETFGEAVWERPAMGRELSLQNSANRYQGLYAAAREKMEELQETVKEMEQLREEEGEELQETAEALKLVQRRRAGLASSLARARSKLEEARKKEVKSKTLGCQTSLSMPPCRVVLCRPTKPCQACSADKLARLVRVEGRTKHLKVFRCEGELGAPLYARLPTTFRTPAGVAALPKKSLQVKAGMVVEAVELLAGGESAAITANTELLIGEVLHLYPKLLEELVRAHPKLLKQMLTLTPSEAIRFTLGAGLSYSQTRKMASMLERLRGIRLFGSEDKRRQQLVSATRLVAIEKLHTIKLMVKQTGRSKFASLCAAVKVADLPALIKELVAEVRVDGGWGSGGQVVVSAETSGKGAGAGEG